MSLRRVAIGTVAFLALTPAFAEDAPKATAKPDEQLCRNFPRAGSHIKEHACGAARDLDRYQRGREQMIAMSGAVVAATTLPPVAQTTTPMQ